MYKTYSFELYPDKIIRAKSIREARTICILEDEVNILDKLHIDNDEYCILTANYYNVNKYYVYEMEKIIHKKRGYMQFISNWKECIDVVWDKFSKDDSYKLYKLYELFLKGKETFYKELHYDKPSFESVFYDNSKALIKYFHNVNWPKLIEHKYTFHITKYAIIRIIKKTKNNNYKHILRLLNIFYDY